MNYCSHCGAGLLLRKPDGDERLRHVCDQCGLVHYQNPKIIAGCIPVWENSILLCKRAIEPRYGTWTLPAGFMELGETLEAAARRESWEEARTNLAVEGLFAIFNVPHISQVHVYFRARLLDHQFGAGVESLETRLFREHEIPWADISFQTVSHCLRLYLEDHRNRDFRLHIHDIVPDAA
jgi:ADP-ribose pyrophosphatase YjhB (NUDIX family)